jgi:hypothetical protein
MRLCEEADDARTPSANDRCGTSLLYTHGLSDWRRRLRASDLGCGADRDSNPEPPDYKRRAIVCG